MLATSKTSCELGPTLSNYIIIDMRDAGSK